MAEKTVCVCVCGALYPPRVGTIHEEMGNIMYSHSGYKLLYSCKDKDAIFAASAAVPPLTLTVPDVADAGVSLKTALSW